MKVSEQTQAAIKRLPHSNVMKFSIAFEVLKEIRDCKNPEDKLFFEDEFQQLPELLGLLERKIEAELSAEAVS